MKYIEAACLCNRGKIRCNNEDNFYFDSRYLEACNDGLSEVLSFRKSLSQGIDLMVFDGMGGENFGEDAAYAAASNVEACFKALERKFFSIRSCLNQFALDLNVKVSDKAKELLTNRMGCTLVSLHFYDGYAYSLNLGDSRSYMLRDGKLSQLSRDHVLRLPGREGRKAPLTQHLGIDPEEMQLEPYINKLRFRLKDRFLICSDGLSDMLSEAEISEILSGNYPASKCAGLLVERALQNGGKDNVTVIVCYIE